MIVSHLLDGVKIETRIDDKFGIACTAYFAQPATQPDRRLVK